MRNEWQPPGLFPQVSTVGSGKHKGRAAGGAQRHKPSLNRREDGDAGTFVDFMFLFQKKFPNPYPPRPALAKNTAAAGVETQAQTNMQQPAPNTAVPTTRGRRQRFAEHKTT